MSSDKIQRQIVFILEHQAKFSEDIGQLREAIGELKDVQKQQGENLDRLTADVQLLAQVVEANRLDTREAIDNLIISKEDTRKLSESMSRARDVVRMPQHSRRWGWDRHSQRSAGLVADRSFGLRWCV
jgi:hypothetical protein